MPASSLAIKVSCFVTILDVNMESNNQPTSGNASCPHLPRGMYTRLSGINFKLVEIATKSKAAQRDCKKDGANLPTIKSEADLALASFLAGK